MSELDTENLSRFVDGEMPPDEAMAFEQRLEDEAELAGAHADFLSLREIINADASAAVEAVDFSDFFSAIDARLGDETPAVVAEAAPIAAREAVDGPWARFTAWLGRNWAPVLVGAAAAAAVAFWVGRPATGPETPVVADNAGSVVVDSVSNEGNKTVLISQPAGDEEGATVIWLLDDEEETKPAEGEDPI